MEKAGWRWRHRYNFLSNAWYCPKIDPKWTHENKASHDLREFFSDQNFANTPEADADEGETKQGFKWWLTMPSRMAQCFYNVFTITSELPDSVRLALWLPPNLKISLIVCPFGVNFGTVLGLLYGESNIITILFRMSYLYTRLIRHTSYIYIASSLLTMVR